MRTLLLGAALVALAFATTATALQAQAPTQPTTTPQTGVGSPKCPYGFQACFDYMRTKGGLSPQSAGMVCTKNCNPPQ
jgi:hypothetical protein